MQFGDFFCDMTVNTVLASTQATLGTVPAFPPIPAGATLVGPASTAQQVSYIDSPGTGIWTQYTQTYVQADGTVLNVGAPFRNNVRYCEYPGQRFFTKVQFEVNGNPLDEYEQSSMFFFQKFRVTPNKQTGWNRLVGQEVPIDGYSDVLAFQGASSWPDSINGLVDVDGNAVVAAPTNASVGARKQVKIVNGYQTPQITQPALDMWIPLLFWFNTDPRLAIPSVSIPYGQRFITVYTEQQQNLLFVAPGNLFAKLVVLETFSAGAGAGTAAALAVTSVQTWTSLTPVLATGSVIDSTQRIEEMQLYINNIFVNPEIHDLYIKRIGFSLIRVHKTQQTIFTTAQGQIQLNLLKFPCETLYVGFRPNYNVASPDVNPNTYRDWHRMTLLTDNTVETSAHASSQTMIDNTIAWNATSAMHKYNNSQFTVEKVVYPISTDTVDTIQLQAHGINIFDYYKEQFFGSYMPYTYGGANIVTPEDRGALMLNFCLYPGTYQPSGHINVSRVREFYLNYVSSYITAATPTTMFVVASAINFILISDGSAVLRYST
jgi:hypothetical protein